MNEQPDAKPVAWRWRLKGDPDWSFWEDRGPWPDDVEVEPLYTAPPRPDASGLIEGLEEAARTAEQTYVEPVFEEETDHNGIYTGKVDLVRKTFFKWRDGPAIAKAIRSRAANRGVQGELIPDCATDGVAARQSNGG